jgi:hypothetical protein
MSLNPWNKHVHIVHDEHYESQYMVVTFLRMLTYVGRQR